MNSTPIELPEEYRQNLLKLADYLSKFQAAPERQFDMSVFDPSRKAHSTQSTCGSVGCAIGHGPYAGIPKQCRESWIHYWQRVFLPPKHFDCFADETDPWAWCFSEDWVSMDNTAAGAAKRIYWLLDHGVPDDADDQISGNAPLCYVTEEACPPN